MKNPRQPTRFPELVGLAMPGGNLRVAENPPVARMAPLDERLVQAIWNEQLLKTDVLVTVDGRPIKVFDPGQWNAEAGPDFRSADIAIGGQRCRGDIEIHVHASDWDRHGHQNDFDYNGVLLHVVLFADDNRTADDLHNGNVAPRLALEDFLEPDLETIRMTLADENFFYAQRSTELGPGCHVEVARMEDGRLYDLLQEAARERMEGRIERYAMQASSSSLDQALYQAIMTSMGHKGGKTLFFLLARRAPLDDLRLVLRNCPPEELPTALEAVLLKVAGLASHAGDPETVDDETRVYLDRVESEWCKYEKYFADRIIPPTRRWMTGIRPVNFPTRRIAGVARFLARTGFHDGLTAWLSDALRASEARKPRKSSEFKRELKGLAELFTASDLSYWSHRYTLTSKPSKSAMALIGQDRASSLVFNAVIPVMLLQARHMGDDHLEKYLWRLHDNFPALQSNTVTKFMRARLFPDGLDRSGLNFRLEWQNQSMIHIFNECCANSSLTCENCVFRRVAHN